MVMLFDHVRHIIIAPAVASAGYMVVAHDHQGFAVLVKNFLLDDRSEESVSPESLFILARIMDLAPVDRRIGRDYANSIGGIESLVHVANRGNQVGIDR